METILVTGAAGFIGQRTCEFLLRQGRYIIGVDNLNNYYDVRLKNHRAKNLQEHKNMEFRELDIENLHALEELFKKHKFEVVVNLAARAG
jgi:nucleoside-diphosphate-sugar epimerase